MSESNLIGMMAERHYLFRFQSSQKQLVIENRIDKRQALTNRSCHATAPNFLA